MAVPPATTPPQAAPAAGAACIVWTAAPAPPNSLTSLLAQRGFALETVSDRFAAMAAACSAAGRSPEQKAVLILDEPEQLRGCQELIEAVRSRAPDVVIWTFEAARRPQLTGLEAPAPRPAPPNRPVNGAVHQEIPLRLAGAAEAGPDGAGCSSILSNEELEMLLADEAEERRRR